MSLEEIFGNGTIDESDENLDLVEQVPEVIELEEPPKKKKNGKKNGDNFNLPRAIKEILKNTSKKEEKVQKDKKNTCVWYFEMIPNGFGDIHYKIYEKVVPEEYNPAIFAKISSFERIYRYLTQHKEKREYTTRHRYLDRVALARIERAVKLGIFNDDIGGYLNEKFSTEIKEVPVNMLSRTTIILENGQRLTGSDIEQEWIRRVVKQNQFNNFQVPNL